jgi:hypothetical protein
LLPQSDPCCILVRGLAEEPQEPQGLLGRPGRQEGLRLRPVRQGVRHWLLAGRAAVRELFPDFAGSAGSAGSGQLAQPWFRKVSALLRLCFQTFPFLLKSFLVFISFRLPVHLLFR